MIKAVIFDFDGTIIDTESVWYRIYRDVLKEDHNFNLPLSEFVKIVGSIDNILFNFLDSNLDSPIDRKLFKKKIRARYNDYKDTLSPREGCLALIENLNKQDIKLAIASSSSRKWVTDLLNANNLVEFFPIILTADDVDKVKPDPSLYLKTLEVLGVKANETIAIEDSANGSLAAIRAGIHCIVIPNEVTRIIKFNSDIKLLNSFEEFDLSHFLKKGI